MRTIRYTALKSMTVAQESTRRRGPFFPQSHPLLCQHRRSGQSSGAGSDKGSPATPQDPQAIPQFLGRRPALGHLPRRSLEAQGVGSTPWTCPCGFHNFSGLWCHSCGGPSSDAETVASTEPLPPTTSTGVTPESTRGPIAEKFFLSRITPSTEPKFSRKSTFRGASFPPRQDLSPAASHQTHAAAASPGKVHTGTSMNRTLPKSGAIHSNGAPSVHSPHPIATQVVVADRVPAGGGGGRSMPSSSSLSNAGTTEPPTTPSAQSPPSQPARVQFKVVKLSVQKK